MIIVLMPGGAELLNAALALPLNSLGVLKIYFLLSLNTECKTKQWFSNSCYNKIINNIIILTVVKYIQNCNTYFGIQMIFLFRK